MLNRIQNSALFTTDTGMLVLRIGLGIVFIVSGWMKVSNMHSTVGFFASIGFNAFWAYLASAVEFLGGIAVLLGVFTRIAAALLVVVMIVAVYVVHGQPTMIMTPLSVGFSALALMFAGAGKYALRK
ncbi:MAG: DoxX family protein [bacterium]